MAVIRPALLGALIAVAAVGAAGAEPLVTLGEVGPTEAVLWVRGGSPGPLTVRYGPAAGGAVREATLRVSAAEDLTGKLRLEGLTPGARHRYVVRDGEGTVEGEFVAPPPADAAVPVRFAWSGDLGARTTCRHRSEGYPIFRALARMPADFFLFVGDTVYADHACGGADRVPGYDFVATTLPAFRAKQRYNREDAAVQAYFRRTAVYAIWDDHEVKNDFAGPTEPLMPLGRQAFLDYFPILPPAEEPGRLYRRFRWGRLLEVFILDTRQYRSPNTLPDGDDKTMLGAAQRRWLIDGVAGSDAVWKVVVSSVSLSVPTGRPERRDSWSSAGFFGGPNAEGTGFAVERDRILGELRRRGVRNLVVVTADVHHAEVIRHRPAPDWSVWELIAGPLAASLGQPRPLDTSLNPTSLFAMGGAENFGEVTVTPAGLTVRIMDIHGGVRFTHAIPPAP